MMVLALGTALGQQIQLSFEDPSWVDSTGSALVIPVEQLEFGVSDGAGVGGAGQQSNLRSLVVSRVMDHRSAGFHNRIPSAFVPGEVYFDFMEPDPADPGALRIRRRWILRDSALSGWKVAIRDGSAQETLTFEVDVFLDCTYTWPGPVTACQGWSVSRNQRQ